MLYRYIGAIDIDSDYGTIVYNNQITGGIMLLKRCGWCLCLCGFLCSATGAYAQIHGLSVLDTADSPGKGTMHAVAGTFTAETSSLYGGRFAYGVTDDMLAFIDLGVHDADHFDPEFLGQLGMRYTLPLNLPFDLAFRATTIPYIASYEHYVEFTVSLLASRYLDSGRRWAVYGGTGLDRQWWELKVPLDKATAAMTGMDTYVDKGNKTDVSYVVGFSGRLSSAFRVFVEGARVDENYGCAGIRYEFNRN